LDQDDLVGALGFVPGFYCAQTRAETLKHLVCLGRREEKSAGWGMANSVTRLCHNCAVKPAYAAQVATFDSSRLLIPCKLQKLRGGPDNPAYRLACHNSFVLLVIALIFSGLRRVTDLSLKDLPPSLLTMWFCECGFVCTRLLLHAPKGKAIRHRRE